MRFMYPGFLWALLALGVPVVIHLLQLRRPQRVRFTNTGFIREVELTTVRRRRVEELLVLLARIAGLVFLVFAFCQPFIPDLANSGTVGANRVEVLVDNSGSMQATGATQPQLLAEAVAGATTLVKGYGTSVDFVLTGRRKVAQGSAASADELSRLQAGRRPVSWGAVSRPASDGASALPLYVFSDFQRSEANATLWKQLAKRSVVLVPETGPPVANIYVDSVWLNDAFVRVQTNVGLHVRLRNGGGKDVADCPVKVLLDGRQAATLQVSIAAGQATESTVQVQLPDDKLALGRVELGDVPVTFDNTFYFTLRPAATIRVVEVGAEPMLRAAYERESLFQYTFARPERVDYAALQRANLVLLREVPRVEANLREALAGVMRRGGSVVVVPPGRGADQTSYQTLLRALGASEARWEPTTANAPARQEVALPNPRDPFFRDVFGVQPRQVTLPQVGSVLRPGSGGTDILRLRDGDAFLTSYGSGRGHCYVFAAPFASEYSNFMGHALFVPVLYRLAMSSSRTDQLPAYRLSAGALTVAVPSDVGDANAASASTEVAPYRLTRDSLSFIPSQRRLGDELRLEVPAGLDAPGFYKLRRGDNVLTTLAFNADKRESELAAYSVAELRRLVGPNGRVLDANARPEALARLGAGQSGTPLWRYCLLLALAALLAEGLLLRFGSARRAVAAPVAQAAV